MKGSLIIRALLVFSFALGATFMLKPMPEASAHWTNYRHSHVRHYRRYRRHRRYRRYRRPYNSRSSVYFGFGGVGAGVITTDNKVTQIFRSGGGFNLFLGYRLNPFVALELGWNSTWHKLEGLTNTTISGLGTGNLQALALDAKIYWLPRSKRIEPFIQVGGGLYLFLRSNLGDHQLTGGGLQIGTGVDIRLNRSIAIGLRVLYKGIYVDDSNSFYGRFVTESAWINQITGSLNIQFHF